MFLGLGFKDFQIVVNHRKLLNAVLAQAGVPAELHGAALVIMDKADKIGVDGVRKELGEKGSPKASPTHCWNSWRGTPPANLAQWMNRAVHRPQRRRQGRD